MQELAQKMAAEGHLEASFIDLGWGMNRQEAFLQNNNALHKTDTEDSWHKYYSLVRYPGIFDYVARTYMEDIVRFNYTAQVVAMRQLLEEDAKRELVAFNLTPKA